MTQPSTLPPLTAGAVDEITEAWHRAVQQPDSRLTPEQWKLADEMIEWMDTKIATGYFGRE